MKAIVSSKGKFKISILINCDTILSHHYLNRLVVALGPFSCFLAVDAMSDAIDGAEVVLFGVSLGYKESANCRLEANYGQKTIVLSSFVY